MASYLIAESGSTKTDWCLLKKGSKPVYFKTQGINPYIQSSKEIAAMLQEEIPWKGKKNKPDNICYYGAGAAMPEKQLMLSGVLKKHFETKKVTVQSDLMAAATALCGDKNPLLLLIHSFAFRGFGECR